MSIETVYDLVLVHAARERMILRIAELAIRPETPCYYFGCVGRAGHHLWSVVGGSITWASRDIQNEIYRALGNLDRELCWNYCLGHASYNRDETEGRALLTHRNNWSAIAFWDRTVDRRGACNSVFVAPGTLTFKQICRLAHHWWPKVWARFDFPIVEVDMAGREV